MILRDAGEAHAFVVDLQQPVLSHDDRHHFERVLRLRAGAPITVADGAGAWRLCRFGLVLEVAGPIVEEPALAPAIGVGFALVKGDRNELVVQKLTELGIDLIVPFVADRSVVRWDAERTGRHHQRLVKVAREAAMQCRRAHLPTLSPATTFAAAAALPGASLATHGGDVPALDHPLVLIGPEGGWSPAEVEEPLPHIGLGKHVLRSETAAIAAATLLAAARERCT